ncbi:MAG: hypothetical protein ABEI53_02920 [Candidatus Magasanikbacteria bacterium]
MKTTIFLSKLIGICALITGIAFSFRWKKFKDMIEDLADNLGVFYIIVFLELVGGVALILSHNLWGNLLQSLVSIFGWIMAAEATLYLLMDHKNVKKIISYFNKKPFYVFGSIFYIALGIYFIYSGFGF